MRKIKLGFVGFGEVNTPREIIIRLCSAARAQLPQSEFDVFETAPVSDDPESGEINRAVMELRQHNFDVLLLCVAGWIPSHAVLAVADHFRHCPMILLGLAGWREGGRLITTAAQAGTTALRQPMAEMGFVFEYVVQTPDGSMPVSAITDFARAARAAAMLRGARIGQMGFRDMQLYATLYDGVSLRGKLGVEIESFEMLEIERLMHACDAQCRAALAQQIRKRWEFVREPQPKTLENTVRLAWALQQKVRERQYAGLSFKDVDGVKKFWQFAPAGALTLLHELEPEISTIPENDTLGAVTQLMLRGITGETAAYLEFYDFLENGVLMGVPDYVPPQIVDGAVRVMPTAFGSFGEGLLNVSKIKTGRVTLVRLGASGNRYFLHLLGGIAKPPPAWEEAGWQPPAPQLPSLEIELETPVADLQQNVLGQHYIFAYGDQRRALRGLARILSLDLLGAR